MYPLDPTEPATPDPKSPMAPPYVDEDPYLDSVRQGLKVAEDEKRDAVTDEYEEQARASANEEESLDDISYPKGNASGSSPELDAIHRTKTEEK